MVTYAPSKNPARRVWPKSDEIDLVPYSWGAPVFRVRFARCIYHGLTPAVLSGDGECAYLICAACVQLQYAPKQLDITHRGWPSKFLTVNNVKLVRRARRAPRNMKTMPHVWQQ